MIYVTHDQVEAMTLADRIAVLNGGHLQQLGTPQSCMTNQQIVLLLDLLAPLLCHSGNRKEQMK